MRYLFVLLTLILFGCPSPSTTINDETETVSNMEVEAITSGEITRITISSCELGCSIYETMCLRTGMQKLERKDLSGSFTADFCRKKSKCKAECWEIIGKSDKQVYGE